MFALTDENFTPIQLKELPPGRLNKTASLQVLLREIAEDPPMPDTVVAIHVNRKGQLGGFTVPPVLKSKLAGLWLYGPTAPKGETWILIGDLLRADHRAWNLALGLE